MGQTTPNIGIYIPAEGETLYGQSFAAGMLNVDQHDHTGAPNKGVPIGAGGIADGSITRQKLNANVVSPGNGLAVDPALPNALMADGLLNSLYKLSSNGVLVRTGAGTAAARTLTGTANQIAVTNGDGVAGNPTFAFPTVTFSTTQPSFLAFDSVTQTDVTGNGAVARVNYTSVIFNQHSEYAANVFTASTTCRILFLGSALISDAATATHGQGTLQTSNRSYIGGIYPLLATNLISVEASAIADMDAGDFCQFNGAAFGMAGNTADFDGTSLQGFFCGTVVL